MVIGAGPSREVSPACRRCPTSVVELVDLAVAVVVDAVAHLGARPVHRGACSGCPAHGVGAGPRCRSRADAPMLTSQRLPEPEGLVGRPSQSLSRPSQPLVASTPSDVAAVGADEPGVAAWSRLRAAQTPWVQVTSPRESCRRRARCSRCRGRRRSRRRRWSSGTRGFASRREADPDHKSPGRQAPIVTHAPCRSSRLRTG